MKDNNKIPGIVFGLFETGLGVIKSLGENQIPVIGIDYQRDIGWYSKYVTPKICPHPREEKELLDWLLDEFKNSKFKHPIFITSDEFLYFVSKYRNQLSNIFDIDLAEHQLLADITDKYKQYLLAINSGVNSPQSWLVTNNQELETIKHVDTFPLFIKGKDVTKWRQHFGGSLKGFLVKDKKELSEKLLEIPFQEVPLIIQELVEGEDDTHFKYCAYVNREGVILAEFMIQKIRQYPIRYGVGCAVKSVYDKNLCEQGRKLFKGIKFQGVGSAEFKWDKKDGKYKLIELNPRYWQQNYLPSVCGINFALVHYNNATNLNLSNYMVRKPYDLGVLWINRYMDFSAFIAYRKLGLLDYSKWRKSLKGKRTYPDFTWKDPLPFFYEIKFGLKIYKIPVFLFKKLFAWN